MRATVAKFLRRKSYGKGHHPGPVVHQWRQFLFGTPKKIMRRIEADGRRQHYQQLKGLWQSFTRKEREVRRHD